MALMHVDFFSDVLGMSMNMDVILPQQTRVRLAWKERQETESIRRCICCTV